jgi:hypothetical protein
VNPARVQLNDAAAISLGLYIDSVRKGKVIDHVAIVFPAYYTLFERMIWRGALEAVNVTSFSEIDDVDAIAMNYAVEGARGFKEKAKTVLFVDVGATSVKAYAVEFAMGKEGRAMATRLSYAIDTENGGAYLTEVLSAVIRERTVEGGTSDVEDKRLFAAAERVKIELSAADSSTVVVEIGGVDRTATVTQAEFLSCVDGLADAVAKVVSEASQGLTVDSVELIGGSSRLPVLETVLKKTLNVDSIGRSLDCEAAIAIGGAYVTQFSLNQSRLPRPNLVTPNSLHTIFFVQGNEDDTVCSKGARCTENLVRPGIWDHFSLIYETNALNGDPAVSTHRFRIGRNSMGEISLHFRAHPFDFLGYEKCNDTCIPGRFIAETIVPIAPEIVRLLVDPQAKTDRIKRLHAEVQSYADRILDEVANNRTVRLFTNHSQRLDIIRCAEREKKWVASPEVAKLSDPRNFSEHIRELKKCIGPVYRRIETNQTFWVEVEKFYELFMGARDLLEEWRSRMKPADKPEIFRFGERLARFEQWFNETLRAEGGRTDWSQDFSIRPKAFRDKYTELNYEVKRMKGKYGGGVKLTRADGTVPTGPEWENLMDLEFVKQMSKELDKDPTGTGRGDAPDLDDL